VQQITATLLKTPPFRFQAAVCCLSILLIHIIAQQTLPARTAHRSFPSQTLLTAVCCSAAAVTPQSHCSSTRRLIACSPALINSLPPILLHSSSTPLIQLIHHHISSTKPSHQPSSLHSIVHHYAHAASLMLMFGIAFGIGVYTVCHMPSITTFASLHI